MDPLTAGVISGAGSILGTAMSNQQSEANAEEQMRFQQMMAGTAHQREVNDLRAAGLNPILSAGGSGASVPGGAMGSVADLGKGISTGMDTAVAVRGQNKELQAKDAGIRQANASADNSDADTQNKQATTSLIRNQTAQTALDIKQKEMSNKILGKTLDSQIKKANAEGDWAQVNQIMGVINSGANSAGQLLKGVNPLNYIPLRGH